MKTETSKLLDIKMISSSLSVVISLSLVLFIIGLLAFLLINATKLSNYAKENIGFVIMLENDLKEIEIIKFK